MKIRTWEKIYWAIILSLIALIAIWIYSSDTLNIEFNGKKVDWSKNKAFIIIGSIVFGVCLVIWLIARLLGNKEKE